MLLRKNAIPKAVVLSGAALLSMFLPGLQIVAGKPAPAPKQYIFSRSNRPTSSNSLGIDAVPAYVNFPDGSQRRGIFVTSATGSGAWRDMGLRPGRVLLSIDNRVVESPASADSILSGKSGSMPFSYVKTIDGIPQLVNANFNYGGGGRLGMAPPVPGALSSSGATDKVVKDDTPLSQLESHMFDLINKDRAANGKASLSNNSRLSDLARNYAEFLLSHGSFSHTADGRDPLARARAAGIGGGIAENLAFQSRGTDSEKNLVSKAEAIFMAEPKDQKNHRYNILFDDFRAAGVGMARSKTTLMMVQEFSDGSP